MNGQSPDFTEGSNDTDLLNQALLTIQQLKNKLASYQNANVREVNEPIAIVGLSAALPGDIYSLDDLWHVMQNGICVTKIMPTSRWPAVSKPYYAGYLENPFEFDNRFFGISPKEAYHLDPQHRLLLMRTEEALQSANINPKRLWNSDTGVFMAIGGSDYYQRITMHPAKSIDAYVASGNSKSMAAGRISHFYGLKGPSVALDTACSSSLYALHQACQSIRLRECQFAIVGAVNLILTPLIHDNFIQAGMLAPDGQCKVFAAHANGYVRSEGCVVVLLTTLTQAQKENYPILALIKSSAVNHDGHTTGLTVPHGPSQTAVIERALSLADLPIDAIDYIEAHGTGTTLGDPIEVNALSHTFRKRQQALHIGAIKANLGHLEIAAGMVSLLKSICMLHHRQIPPQLFCNPLNPHIDWSDAPIKINTQPMPWPHTRQAAYIGLSSFGFSGTNVHMIVTSPPSLLPSLPKHPACFHYLQHFEVPYQSVKTAIKITPQESSPKIYEEYWLPLERPSLLKPFALQPLAENHLNDWTLAEQNYQHYCQLLQHLEQKCMQQIGEFFLSEMHVSTRDALVQLSNDVFLQAGIVSKYHQLLTYLQEQLTRYLQTNNEVNIERALPTVTWPALLMKFPNYQQEITFMRRCLETLHQIFYGRTEATELLFDGKEYSLAHQLYHNTAVGEYFNQQIAKIVASFCQQNSGRMLHILEVGAGSGATTKYVLPYLEKYKISYYFTDVSVYFLHLAQKTFGHYHFIHYELLDLTDPASNQKLKNRKFDLVIAANVVHATPVIRKTLTLLYEYLQPNGLFILRECTRPTLTADLTFGLNDGWWCFLNDPDRDDYPLLSHKQWIDLLQKTHFSQVTILETLADSYEHVFLGTRPAYPLKSESIIVFSADPNVLAESQEYGWRAIRLSNHFSKDIHNSIITIDQLCAENYHAIFSTFHDDDPTHIIILFCVDVNCASTNQLEQCWQQAFLAPIYCLQSLSRYIPNRSKLTLIHSEITADSLSPYSDINYAMMGSVRGLIRVMALEYPIIFNGLITLDQLDILQAWHMVQQELQDNKQENEVIVKKNKYYVRRLQERPIPTMLDTIDLNPAASYLITGASGGLGKLTMEWLTAHNARHLVLLARHMDGEDPTFKQTMETLHTQGVQIVMFSLDISDQIALQALFAKFGNDLPPLKGIFHSAGIGGDELIANINPDTLADMLKAKVLGSYFLHLYAKQHALDYFVIYSSVIATWGAKARAHYAAVNAFSIELIKYRRQRGLPGLVIDWGPWKNVGMINTDSQALAEAVGVQVASEDSYLGLMAQAIQQDLTHAIITTVDWGRFKHCYSMYRNFHLLDQLVSSDEQQPLDQSHPDSQPTASALPTITTEEQIADCLALALGYDSANNINYQRGFYDQGLDSLLALSFVDNLNTLFSSTIKLADLFNYPTITQLSSYIKSLNVECKPVNSNTDLSEQSNSNQFATLMEQLDQQLQVYEAISSEG